MDDDERDRLVEDQKEFIEESMKQLEQAVPQKKKDKEFIVFYLSLCLSSFLCNTYRKKNKEKSSHKNKESKHAPPPEQPPEPDPVIPPQQASYPEEENINNEIPDQSATIQRFEINLIFLFGIVFSYLFTFHRSSGREFSITGSIRCSQ